MFHAMIKRIAAALLWFYVVWAAWNAVVLVTGWSILLGPVIAAAVSAVIAGDPMHSIWAPRASGARTKSRLESINAQG